MCKGAESSGRLFAVSLVCGGGHGVIGVLRRLYKNLAQGKDTQGMVPEVVLGLDTYMCACIHMHMCVHAHTHTLSTLHLEEETPSSCLLFR